ncbi:MAG: mycothiol system anti-sigma-R factor [Egibacteraceae bacterium]
MDDCDGVLERLEHYLDGECPKDLERIVHIHLKDCPTCLDRADFERELRRLIASKCKEAAPPGLLDRILASLRS